jgi:hypothetical protein
MPKRKFDELTDMSEDTSVELNELVARVKTLEETVKLILHGKKPKTQRHSLLSKPTEEVKTTEEVKGEDDNALHND